MPGAQYILVECITLEDAEAPSVTLPRVPQPGDGRTGI